MTGLNFSWLEDFMALAASGNFSRAADERNMTQPAFSRRIRSLEEWLGTELFDRTSQPARLTTAGKWFNGVAEELLIRVSRMPGEAQAVVNADSTTLRFAATHALSFTFVPPWLRGLESRIAIAQIRLVSDVLQRCEMLLINFDVQFLISHSHPKVVSNLDSEFFPSIQIGSDILLPVSAPDTDGKPLHSIIKYSDGIQARMLSYSTESGIGRIIEAVFETKIKNLNIKTVFTAHLASVLRTMALDGRGVAWLPHTLIADDLKNGLLIDAASSDWRIPMEVRLYRDRGHIGKVGEELWTAVTASADGLPPLGDLVGGFHNPR